MNSLCVVWSLVPETLFILLKLVCACLGGAIIFVCEKISDFISLVFTCA